MTTERDIHEDEVHGHLRPKGDNGLEFGPTAYATPTPTPSADEPAQPAPEPAPPIEPKRFVKWTVAAFAVIPAMLGIEVLVIIVAIMALAMVALVMQGLPDLTALSTNDAVLAAAMMLIELFTFLCVMPWWSHVEKRGVGLLRRGKAQAAPVAGRVAAILAMGVSAQVLIAFVLNAVLPLFPEVLADYEELMEASGLTTLTLWSFLAASVVGPILEETLFRGVAFQFALRAVCRGWSKALPPWKFGELRVTEQQFWIANLLQAAVFGLAHMNVVQTPYAFASGLLMGWVFWRTGKLRYSMGLHMTFNTCSWALMFMPETSLVADLVILAVAVALLAGGLWLFNRSTRGCALPYADPNEPVETEEPLAQAAPTAPAGWYATLVSPASTPVDTQPAQPQTPDPRMNVYPRR